MFGELLQAPSPKRQGLVRFGWVLGDHVSEATVEILPNVRGPTEADLRGTASSPAPTCPGPPYLISTIFFFSENDGAESS
mgnify:CR=1 FL=1